MALEESNSLSKQEAVEQLQKTIEQLETIVQKINANSIENVLSSAAIDNLIKTTTELETTVSQTDIIQDRQELATESQAPTDKVIAPQKQTIIIEPDPARNRNVGLDVEPQKTPVATENVSQQSLPNNQSKSNNRQKILIAIAILLLGLIPISWKLLANKPPALIAQDPLQTMVGTETEETVPSIVATEPTVDSPLTEVAPLDSAPLAAQNTEIPPVIEVDKRPKKVNIKTLKVAKNLTPEQTLIAAIENKEREIVSNYVDDLVITVEPNFNNSVVTVALADEWYTLDANEQDKITEKILKKVWQLKFDKLKIVDSQSNLIARNPVVGKNIVVLKRTI